MAVHREGESTSIKVVLQLATLLVVVPAITLKFVLLHSIILQFDSQLINVNIIIVQIFLSVYIYFMKYSAS